MDLINSESFKRKATSIDSSDDDDAENDKNQQPDEAPLSSVEAGGGGGACEADGGAETVPTKRQKKSSKASKKQALRRSEDSIEIADISKIVSSLEAEKFSGVTSKDASSSEKWFYEIFKQSENVGVPFLNPTVAYDLLGSFLIEKNAGRTAQGMDGFLERLHENYKTYSYGNSPYESCGLTFLSPLFESERISDIKDVDRRRTGPAMRKGVVKCRKCRSKYTHSAPKQDRSGDEPMSFIHDCRMCGEHWKTSG